MADKKTISVVIPTPQKASGGAIYDLRSTAEKQFDEVKLGTDSGEHIIVGEGAVNIGSAVFDYIIGTSIAALSGRGDIGDGLTKWSMELAGRSEFKNLGALKLTLVPAGRGGTYEATFAQLLAVVQAKGKFVVDSMKKYPRSKSVRENESGPKEEAVDVVLI